MRCRIVVTMKIKNIKNILLVPFVSSLTAVALVSCDGVGGGGSDSADNSDNKIIVELPDNPNEATADTGNGADPNTDSTQEEQYADEVFAAINQERADNGLPALVRDSSMGALCADHNNYMINNANPGGALEINHDNAQSRADALFAVGFKSFAENTAAHRGYPSGSVASEFVNGWVNSPGHLKNILGNYTSTGVAVTVDSRDGTVYATQIFGSK